MPPLSTYTASLPTDVLLDSGVLYIGAPGARTVFSAQEGGLKFDPGKTIRDVAFAGQRTRVKGLSRTVNFAPKFTGTILEVSPTTMTVLEPGVTTGVVMSGSPSGLTSGFQPKAAGILYATGDYLSTISAVWQRGDGTYVQVRFYDGAEVIKWDIAGTDKQEGKITVEIDALLDMSVSGRHTSDAPYIIEYFTQAPS